jgi:putative transposase
MDETYINVKGQWVYLYRAIDANGFPKKVVMDKTSANYAGQENINILLMLAGLISFVEILHVEYLNNLIEQDHHFIKKITDPVVGFKAFQSANATIDGIETAHMIQKGQLSAENIQAYKQFMALAG